MVHWLAVALASAAIGCFTKPPAPGSGDGGGGNGVAPNIAFVTSEARPVTQITGLVYADAWCMEAAGKASPPLAGTFRAWLSSSSENAQNRFGTARGWVRVDGKPFADSIDDLVTDRRLYYPLRIDENGDDILPADPYANMTPVATGTNESGNVSRNQGNEVENCGDWTGGGTGTIRLGYHDAAGSAWTAGTLRTCDASLMARIYCLGTDRVSQVDSPPVQGARIFVTDDVATANLGIAGFDARCTSEASAGELDGDFRALVATSAASALSRVGGAGKTWTRVDGVIVTSDFVSFSAPVAVSARGVYLAKGLVWTGSVAAGATGTETCGDWSSADFESARAGELERATERAFGAALSRCDSLNPTRLYCAEVQPL